ncbi:type I restriction endonuclease subunit S [Bacteroidia bacterium]|nr:type I restriction endonuclease subunit S [Bacteroidia bacterium]
MSLNKHEIKKNVPKLRFPEFRDAWEWEEVPFGELYSYKPTNSFTRDNLNYNEGTAKNIHYGDIHTKFSTLFDIRKEIVPYINSIMPIEKYNSEGYCKEGDMIFADASEDTEGIGKSIEIIRLNNEKLLSGLHTLLARQKKSKLIVGFGGHLFMSNAVRVQIQKESQGAKVLGISATRLSNIKIWFPQNKNEQQKIADCLSSIDELITAQSQKLEALTAHKKGLMQQLFPAEGEMVPKLRFAEFRDAGEWEIKDVGDVFEVTRGNVLAMSLVKENSNSEYQYPVYSSQTKNDGLAGFYDDFLFEDAITWTTDGANAGEVNYRAGKFYCTNVCGVLINLNGYANPCIAALINSVSKKHVSYVGNPKLMNGVMSKIEIPIPSLPEQQKIADCLSSIDELITAQSQKLEALTVHKKGLMQQLFPNIKEQII